MHACARTDLCLCFLGTHSVIYLIRTSISILPSSYQLYAAAPVGQWGDTGDDFSNVTTCSDLCNETI